jgi:transposase, IS5 family
MPSTGRCVPHPTTHPGKTGKRPDVARCLHMLSAARQAGVDETAHPGDGGRSRRGLRAVPQADKACEEALLDSTALRRFVGIDLGRERVPDGTTLLKFRRLLEKHDLGAALFAKVGEVLQSQGLKLGTGTIVDATIIVAPGSTKNADKQRDPEMHQTRTGNPWCFGMKIHVGVDSRTGLAHSAMVTAAYVHDKHPLPDLLHGDEQRVYGDSADARQKALIASKAPKAKDFTNERVCKGEIAEDRRAKNRNKSKVRARVEHVFAVVKRLWGFATVRYRGLAKNATRSFVVLGLANLYLARQRLLA